VVLSCNCRCSLGSLLGQCCIFLAVLHADVVHCCNHCCAHQSNNCGQPYIYPCHLQSRFILSTIYQEQVKDPALACPRPHLSKQQPCTHAFMHETSCLCPCTGMQP
jgi:hypothetical protein